MLKRSEYAELKMDSILNEMQAATGLSVAELQLLDKVKAQAAQKRMNELGIAYPDPKGTGIKLVHSMPSSKAYRAKQQIAGKGMQQQAAIGLDIFTSMAIESDDRLWFHASITRHDGKMPTYENLCWLRERFFHGRWAVQYFPPKEQHVSHHDKCLHLWTCMESFEMPDFRKFGTI